MPRLHGSYTNFKYPASIRRFNIESFIARFNLFKCQPNIYDIAFFLDKELLLKNKSERIIEKEKVLSIKFRNKLKFEDEDEHEKIRF